VRSGGAARGTRTPMAAAGPGEAAARGVRYPVAHEAAPGPRVYAIPSLCIFIHFMYWFKSDLQTKKKLAPVACPLPETPIRGA